MQVILWRRGEKHEEEARELEDEDNKEVQFNERSKPHARMTVWDYEIKHHPF